MGIMTALEVYEAFYATSNDSKSLIADFNGNEVEAIKAYADGAFDIVLTDETVSDTTLIFVSTNEDVAKVSNNGIIKAISSGKCKIYIKSNGSAFERMDVVVN